MKIRRLIEFLEEFPDEADVVLSGYTAVKDVDEHGREGFYSIGLSCPIVGTILDERTNQLQFVVNQVCSKKLDRVYEQQAMLKFDEVMEEGNIAATHFNGSEH